MQLQKPPDLDEKGRPVDLDENKRPIVLSKNYESSIDDFIPGTKRTTGPSQAWENRQVKPVITQSDDIREQVEPIDFKSGFKKSIKDDFFGTIIPAIQSAAQPRGESKIETLGNIGNLLLPAGMESAIAGAKALRGKKTGNVAKIAEEVAKPIESKLNLSSELPTTKEPILDASGRDIAPSQQISEHGPYPNYPTKGSNIFQRMGMGVERADDVARGNIAAEKVTPKKLPYKTKDGKLYLKEVTKENIDQLYNDGYELNPDGSIVKAAEKVKPTANFAYHQDNFEGGSIPIYNVEGGPLHRSSVSAETLGEHGISVPETPPFVAGVRGSKPADIPFEQQVLPKEEPVNFKKSSTHIPGPNTPVSKSDRTMLDGMDEQSLNDFIARQSKNPNYDTPTGRGMLEYANEVLEAKTANPAVPISTELPKGSKATNITPEYKADFELWHKFKKLYDSGKMTEQQMLEWGKVHNRVKDIRPNGTFEIQPYKFDSLPVEEPEFTTYLLPDGQEIQLKTDLTKGAEKTTFQMKGGEVVEAVKKVVDDVEGIADIPEVPIKPDFADKVLAAPVDNSAPLFSGGKGRKAKPVENINKETGEIVDDAPIIDVNKGAEFTPRAAEPPKVPPSNTIPQNTGGNIPPSSTVPPNVPPGNVPPQVPPVGNALSNVPPANVPPIGGGNLPPTNTPPVVPGNVPPTPSQLQQWWNLPRDLMSTDLPFMTSAAFRQGSTQVGTKAWFEAWGKAAKAYGSTAANNAMNAARNNNPLFASTVSPTGKRIPGFAERMGLRVGDYTIQNNPHIANLAERIPIYGRHIKASNRAFNAFVNHIAEAKFTSLVDDGQKLAATARQTGKARPGFFKIDAPNPDMFDPLLNEDLGREIAGLVNTSLKRGDLSVELGKKALSFEKHASALANVFFSPRNMSSEARMLNPSTYITAPPEIRIQYMANLARRLSMWGGIATLAKIAGADVSLNPTNADFGKIKLGDTRIDLPGGLQQFLVLGARMYQGGTTSSTDPNAKFKQFGKGYKPETRGSTAGKFITNRLHPSAKFGVDAMFANEKNPFHTGDRVVQLMAPMFVDDMTEVFKRYPELTPVMGFLSSAGIGTQSYERGSFGKSKYIPEKIDFNIGAKR